MADLVMQMRANLDLDSVEFLWIEGSDLNRQVQDTRSSEVLRLEKQKIFCKGDQKEVLANCDRDALLRRYRAGQRWLCAEYRRADRNGNVRWVRHILYLTEDPASRQVCLFVYLIWLALDRSLGQVLRGEGARDAVSYLYNRDAVQRMAETLFSDRKSGNRAVVVLQINGLEKRLDDPETERMFYGISAGLSLVLGGSCLLGKYSPNQIVVAFPDVTEQEGLRRCLEEVITVLRRMLSPEPSYRALRLIMGVDLMPATTANYRSMLAQAIQVCTFWWNAASDTVAFTQEEEDWNWAQLLTDKDDQAPIHATEKRRPLSESEKGLALDGV